MKEGERERRERKGRGGNDREWGDREQAIPSKESARALCELSLLILLLLLLLLLLLRSKCSLRCITSKSLLENKIRISLYIHVLSVCVNLRVCVCVCVCLCVRLCVSVWVL